MNEEFKNKLSEEEVNAQVDYLSGAKCNHTFHKYIDITGDLIEGTLLSRIIYWFTPDKNGRSKIRVVKDGKLWIAKQRKDWWEEIRITERQYDKAIKGLEQKGFVVLAKYKFNSMPTVHIRPNYENINKAVATWEDKLREELFKENDLELHKTQFGNNTKCNSLGNYTKCNSGVTQSGNPLTCITNNDYINKDYSMDTCSCERKSAPPSPLDVMLDNVFTEENLVLPNDVEGRKSELKEIIEYFLRIYMETYRKTHWKLTEESLRTIADEYLYPDDDEYNIMEDVYTFEDYKPMIDLYFMTQYRVGIEKSLFHFMSGLIRRNLKAKLIE